MAKGTVNYEGIDEQEERQPGTSLLPKGKYLFQITEKIDKTSAKGDPMVNITLQCQEDGFERNKVWDNIVIPNPNSPSIGIAGRTKHFLHCIGEPYQGQFNWDSDNWAWKKVYANVVIKKLDSGKEINNVVGYVLDEDLINKFAESNNDSFPF